MGLSSLGRELVNYVDRIEKTHRYAIRKMADDIERDAPDIIRKYIMSTPSGISPTKKNRYLTGAMYDNAAAKKQQLGNNWKIEYGWFGFINPDNPGDYVKAQELGGGIVSFGMHSFHAVQNRVTDILLDYRKGKYFGSI